MIKRNNIYTGLLLVFFLNILVIPITNSSNSNVLILSDEQFRYKNEDLSSINNEKIGDLGIFNNLVAENNNKNSSIVQEVIIDTNQNRIDDDLERIISESKDLNYNYEELQSQKLSIILYIKKSNTSNQDFRNYEDILLDLNKNGFKNVQSFKDYLNEDYFYISCEIFLNKCEIIKYILSKYPQIQYIKENIESNTLMQYALPQCQIYPYLHEDYGLKGDNNSAIAIIDSGIDATHPMLLGYGDKDPSKKIIGWVDFTSEKSPSPYDTTEHGTYVSSIAAGMPYNSTDSEERTVLSKTTWRSWSGIELQTFYLDTPVSFNVTAPGRITANGSWEVGLSYSKAEVHNITIINPQGVYVANATFSGQNVNTIVEYDVDENHLGIYKIGFIFKLNGSLDKSYQTYLDVHYPFDYTKPYLQGVAPESKIVMLRAGTEMEIVNAFNWILENGTKYNITTVNMSFKIASSLVKNVASQLSSHGFIPVASAGNEYGFGFTANTFDNTPGSIDDVISVGAIDNLNHIASYSSSGGVTSSGLTSKPDILAPGGEFASRYSDYLTLLGADANGKDYVGDPSEPSENKTDRIINDIKPNQGTSFSSAYVSGVTQLIIQALGGIENWNYSKQEVLKIKAWLSMTASEIAPNTRNWFTGYDPTLNRGEKDYQEGYGRINPKAIVDMLTQKMEFNTLYSGILTAVNENKSFNEIVYARNLTLDSMKYYKVNLTVPDGADFDIYIYENETTSVGDPILLKKGTSSILGGDEVFQFSPNKNGTHFFVIKAIRGSGEFSINISEHVDTINPQTALLYTPSHLDYIRGNKQFNLLFEDAETGVQNIEFHLSQLDNETRTVIIEEIQPWTKIYENIFYWNTNSYNDGWYNLTLTAVDKNQNKLNSTTITICIDNTSPSVALLQPKQSDELHGLFKIVAQGTDILSGLNHMEIYISTRLPNVINIEHDSEGIIEYNFYSTRADDGFCYIWIKAYDNAGNNRETVRIYVIVENIIYERINTIILFTILGICIIINIKIAEKILINSDVEKLWNLPSNIKKKIQNSFSDSPDYYIPNRSWRVKREPDNEDL